MCRKPLFQTRPALLVVLLATALWHGGPAAHAHEGPPFALFLDRPALDYEVSVWADPDIGEATFFIIVESPGDGPPSEAPTASLWVEPTNGRLERASYPAAAGDFRNRLQFQAEPHFDQRDVWTIGVVLTAPDGRRAELTTEVESTPPGPGVWGLAVYSVPFVLFGGLWVAAMLRRRAAGVVSEEPKPVASGSTIP